MNMKRKISRRDFLRRVSENHDKLNLANRLNKFMIASVLSFVLAIPFIINDYVQQKTNTNLIERIDGQRKISRSINTYNFLRNRNDYDFYSNYYVKPSEIRGEVIKMISLKGTQGLWTKEMIDNTSFCLAYFNNDNYFMLDWRVFLAIIAHESAMNPYRVSPTNFDGTRDYGIGQNNSRDIDWRFRQAVLFNKKILLINPKLINEHRLNLYAGLISTAIHLKEDRDEIISFNKRYPASPLGPDMWVVAYNSGMAGMMRGNYRKKYIEVVESHFNQISL